MQAPGRLSLDKQAEAEQKPVTPKSLTLSVVLLLLEELEVPREASACRKVALTSGMVLRSFLGVGSSTWSRM